MVLLCVISSRKVAPQLRRAPPIRYRKSTPTDGQAPCSGGPVVPCGRLRALTPGICAAQPT
jgi:hypothetical protein